jgi:hypothetical protein
MATSLRHACALPLAAIVALVVSASSELACTTTTNDCVDVDPSTYDRSCSADSDCTVIDVGHLCNGGCLCGFSAAINVAGLEKYNAATAGISPGGCECGFPGTPSCVAGQCELAVPGGVDAGMCHAGDAEAMCD